MHVSFVIPLYHCLDLTQACVASLQATLPAGLAHEIILVDDGIATGATVKAGLKALRRVGVGSILLAVPVAPREVLAELERNVDRIVCLHVPRKLRSVGLHYADFEQTTDGEVTELLSRNNARRA